MEEFVKLVEDVLYDLESVHSIDYKKEKLQTGKYQIKLSMIIDKSMIDRNKPSTTILK